MRVLDGRLGRGPIVSCALATAAVATLAFDLVVDARPTVVTPLVLVLLLLGLTYQVLLPWQGLLTAVVAVIFFIPVKRYSLLPSALPFSLEPYRVLIALVAAAWLTSLLVDPRVRLRRSGLEPPMILFGIAALASVGVNGGRIAELGVSSVVVKTLTFWLSFFLLFYVVVSVVRSRSELDALIRALVFCGTVVAAFAMVESRTGFNVFNYLGRLTPALHFNDPAVTAGLTATYLDRSGLRRVYSSTAHPIELAAILTMLAPLALYLLKSTKRKRWLVAFVLLAMGSLTTLSRTGVIMLVVIALVFLWLRPEQTRRLWPALVPAICVIYFLLPNTLGSIYSAFFPKQGLVAQQTQRAALGDGEAADGRLARVGPSIAEWSKRPLLGEGFGSRVTAVNEAIVPRGVTLSNILDDQWLGSLLETGIIGVVALLWLFTRSIRRMTRIARADDGDDGWLAVALASSVYAFAISMLTFDALGFVQVTILFFLLLALMSVFVRLRALAEPAQRPPAPEERGVDPQLAGALNSLLGALDRLPANEDDDDEARLQPWLPYDRGGVPRWRKVPRFLRWFGPRLLRSQRHPYRMLRRVAVRFAWGCIVVGIIVMVAWFLV